jgi:very-short-patch-repair endonuclease
VTDSKVKFLRVNQTAAELLLWAQLRKKRVGSVRFRRRFRIGPYIVDFACLAARLIVEVDGPSHDMTFAADERRTQFLEEQEFRVLRVRNKDVRSNLEGVVKTIELAIAARPLPQAPSRKGRGEKPDWLRPTKR